MQFTLAELSGVYLVTAERLTDERLFARTFCLNEFAEHGLISSYPQSNVSYNGKKGTLRGMHFQLFPHEEVKYIRCSRGKIFDVVVDMRPVSVTYKKWLGVELSADNLVGIYVPAGFAHGFITLEDNTEVLYQMSAPYVASSASGIHYKDPEIGIEWPAQPTIVSARDEALLPFAEWERQNFAVDVAVSLIAPI